LTIPKLTPYELIGSATDEDNDNLIYIWEEFDQGNGEPLGTNFASGHSTVHILLQQTNTRMIPRFSYITSETFDIADRMPDATRDELEISRKRL
jgi:hypothetical protein